MATQGKHEQVHVRVGAAELNRIDRAAALSGATRSAFVLAAALARADEVLFDRLHYAWPEAALHAFRAALAEPPPPAPRAAEAADRRPWDAP